MDEEYMNELTITPVTPISDNYYVILCVWRQNGKAAIICLLSFCDRSPDLTPSVMVEDQYIPTSLFHDLPDTNSPLCS